MSELKETLSRLINSELYHVILSNPRDKEKGLKVKIRPVLLKDQLVYQLEEQVGKQAFHKNLSAEECCQYISQLLEEQYRQAEISSAQGQAHVLVSKKGAMTIKVKKVPGAKIQAPVSHNRKKNYILEEGIPVPFLEDLGVMTADGKVVRTRYDKFRQINRFLEFIEDILPKLDKTRENTIIDFGCGKSYLTFAMYYYLHVLKGYAIRIIGLDLKMDVIEHCNALSEKFGFDHLKFYHGDIADFEGVDQVDMVVTLHACDTATDYALAKAVNWGAKVILSVPCCQHELNKQISSDIQGNIFQYGLLKERMAALYTDGIRAEILENQGYRTQILEFIDMEHTPKNILIRAIKQGKPKDNKAELDQLIGFLHADPTLYKLLM